MRASYIKMNGFSLTRPPIRYLRGLNICLCRDQGRLSCFIISLTLVALNVNRQIEMVYIKKDN